MTKTDDADLNPVAAPAKPFSIADIEAQVATEETFDFEPTLPNLEPSGVIFRLKSDLAPSVEAKLQALIDGRSRKDQLRAAQAEKSRPGDVIIPIEENATFSRKAIAIRVAGWNLPDEFNEANVMRVLKAWSGLGDQILAKTAELARFTKASPTG